VNFGLILGVFPYMSLLFTAGGVKMGNSLKQRPALLILHILLEDNRQTTFVMTEYLNFCLQAVQTHKKELNFTQWYVWEYP
jgi:hypothetical protein